MQDPAGDDYQVQVFRLRPDGVRSCRNRLLVFHVDDERPSALVRTGLAVARQGEKARYGGAFGQRLGQRPADTARRADDRDIEVAAERIERDRLFCGLVRHMAFPVLCRFLCG